MTVLMVPALDATPYPSLGRQVCAFIESFLVFGPGDLRGQPARLDAEKRGLIYRMYEVFPPGHPQAGRRRFKRVGLSLRKGSAKTELSAWIAAVELHPDGPVRCDGFDSRGEPVGRGVVDPYIPLVAYTEEQSDELAYGALRVILEHSQVADAFDIGLERIMRVGGDGKAVALATAPNARDGARTTLNVFDEPLALDTPVPTPDGWTTIGAIQPGAMVFGRDGAATRVVGVSPVHEGRPCYRVTFAGGDSIVTDARHRWAVVEWSRGEWGRTPGNESVRTTEHMYINGLATTYGKRWRLPRHAGYDGTCASLPIDPYVLGVWLGDGATNAGYIHAGRDDVDELRALVEAAGYRTTVSNDLNADKPRAVRFIPEGLRAQLTTLKVRGDKHIPAAYLFASRAQRLALLQGLMDTDGYTTRHGTCTFVQGRQLFAEAVRDLLLSLGTPATVTVTEDARSRTGVMFKVHFSPAYCPFRLKRKAVLCPGRSRVSTHWPTVVAIEPCESVPVKCIAVDSEDRLFLAGRGLRLTHNTHRFVLPRLKQAHRAMLANIPKRRLADAWSLEITTAPSPGEGSVAEDTMDYARAVEDGRVKDSTLFFFHRQASEDHDLTTRDGIRAAVVEASGPVAGWSDVDGIVDQWNDPTADRAYLQRVWLNQLVRASDRAFDAIRWRELARPDYAVPKRALITLGFDGSRFEDATALVGTEIETGHQWLVGLWEKPPNRQNWEVPEHEVTAAIDRAFDYWEVWRLYADPPYWESQVAEWAGKYGDERVWVWRTNRMTPMAIAVRAYANAIQSGELTHDGSAGLARHLGNACRRVLTIRDDQGQPLWVIYKERKDSPHKIDAAMAAILSWEARTVAIAAGVVAGVYGTRGAARWWEPDWGDDDATAEPGGVAAEPAGAIAGAGSAG